MGEFQNPEAQRQERLQQLEKEIDLLVEEEDRLMASPEPSEKEAREARNIPILDIQDKIDILRKERYSLLTDKEKIDKLDEETETYEMMASMMEEDAETEEAFEEAGVTLGTIFDGAFGFRPDIETESSAVRAKIDEIKALPWLMQEEE